MMNNLSKMIKETIAGTETELLRSPIFTNENNEVIEGYDVEGVSRANIELDTTTQQLDMFTKCQGLMDNVLTTLKTNGISVESDSYESVVSSMNEMFYAIGAKKENISMESEVSMESFLSSVIDVWKAFLTFLKNFFRALWSFLKDLFKGTDELDKNSNKLRRRLDNLSNSGIDFQKLAGSKIKTILPAMLGMNPSDELTFKQVLNEIVVTNSNYKDMISIQVKPSISHIRNSVLGSMSTFINDVNSIANDNHDAERMVGSYNAILSNMTSIVPSILPVEIPSVSIPQEIRTKLISKGVTNGTRFRALVDPSDNTKKLSNNYNIYATYNDNYTNVGIDLINTSADQIVPRFVNITDNRETSKESFVGNITDKETIDIAKFVADSISDKNAVNFESIADDVSSLEKSISNIAENFRNRVRPKVSKVAQTVNAPKLDTQEFIRLWITDAIDNNGKWGIEFIKNVSSILGRSDPTSDMVKEHRQISKPFKDSYAKYNSLPDSEKVQLNLALAKYVNHPEFIKAYLAGTMDVDYFKTAEIPQDTSGVSEEVVVLINAIDSKIDSVMIATLNMCLNIFKEFSASLPTNYINFRKESYKFINEATAKFD